MNGGCLMVTGFLSFFPRKLFKWVIITITTLKAKSILQLRAGRALGPGQRAGEGRTVFLGSLPPPGSTLTSPTQAAGGSWASPHPALGVGLWVPQRDCLKPLKDASPEPSRPGLHPTQLRRREEGWPGVKHQGTRCKGLTSLMPLHPLSSGGQPYAPNTCKA